MRTCKECKAFDVKTSTCRRHAPQPDVLDAVEDVKLVPGWMHVDPETDWCLGGFVSLNYEGDVRERQWQPRRSRRPRNGDEA